MSEASSVLDRHSISIGKLPSKSWSLTEKDGLGLNASSEVSGGVELSCLILCGGVWGGVMGTSMIYLDRCFFIFLTLRLFLGGSLVMSGWSD